MRMKIIGKYLFLIKNNGKYHSLLALYDHIYGEISRYRDMEWKICYWTILLQAKIIAAYKYVLEIPQIMNHKYVVNNKFY
jgi:hypothetical protein